MLSGGTVPTRTLLGIIGGVVVLLLLLGYALSRGGDDTNDDRDVTPTATVQSIFNPATGPNDADANVPSTPGSDPPTEASDTEPPSSESQDATEPDARPRPGGDNQLDLENDSTETPTAASIGTLARGPARHGFQRS